MKMKMKTQEQKIKIKNWSKEKWTKLHWHNKVY